MVDSGFKDITNQRFGRLTAIKRIGNKQKPNGTKGLALWKCQCDCGKKISVSGAALRSGNTRSCGCLQRDTVYKMNFVHGQAHTGKKTPEWRTWIAMLNRCFNTNTKFYKYYGGSGVTVCKRWLKFANFFADMGLKPAGLTIDRINPYGDYEPSNCRWATRLQQVHNRRRNQRHAPGVRR